MIPLLEETFLLFEGTFLLRKALIPLLEGILLLAEAMPDFLDGNSLLFQGRLQKITCRT